MKTIYIVHYKTGRRDDYRNQVIVALGSDVHAKEYCSDFNRALLDAGLHCFQKPGKTAIFSYRGESYPIDYTGAMVYSMPIVFFDGPIK